MRLNMKNRGRHCAGDRAAKTYSPAQQKSARGRLEEERTLIPAAQAGDRAALARVCEQHRPFVVHMAKRHEGNSRLSLDDLIQEGYCGLLTALGRFDVGRGVLFLTYASWYVVQSLQKACERDNREARQSLTAPIGPEDDDDLLLSLLAAPAGPPAPDEAEEGFGRLDAREAWVIRTAFGLRGEPKLTLRTQGQLLGTSKETARKILNAALDKLRTAHGLPAREVAPDLPAAA